MKPMYLISLSMLCLGLVACSADNAPKPEEKAPATQPAPEKKPEAKAAAPKPVAGEGVHFVHLKDGAQVATSVKLAFAVKGKTVRPAGEAPEETTSGHHHVIIDGAAMPAGTIIPMDDTHKHYGKGQTEAKIELAPGPHTLTLQFADGAHRSYGPAWSQTIKVVAADAKPAAEEAPKVAAPKAAAPAEKK